MHTCVRCGRENKATAHDQSDAKIAAHLSWGRVRVQYANDRGAWNDYRFYYGTDYDNSPLLCQECYHDLIEFMSGVDIVRIED